MLTPVLIDLKRERDDARKARDAALREAHLLQEELGRRLEELALLSLENAELQRALERVSDVLTNGLDARTVT